MTRAADRPHPYLRQGAQGLVPGPQLGHRGVLRRRGAGRVRRRAVLGRRRPSRLARVLAWVGCILLTLRVLDIYLEFGLALTGIRPVPTAQRDELARLARWFLFLCCRGSPSASASGGVRQPPTHPPDRSPGRGDRGRLNEKEST
jgi:hypothetical protein